MRYLKKLMVILLFSKLYSAFNYFPIPSRFLFAGIPVDLRNDAGSIFSNPAGLDSLVTKQIETTYSLAYPEMDEDISGYTVLSGMSLKLGLGVGVGFSYLDVDRIYKESEILIGAGIKGDRIHLPVSVGFNLKFLKNKYIIGKREEGDIVFSKGKLMKTVSIDLGFIFRKEKFLVSLSLKDINRPDVGIYESVRKNCSIDFDISYRVFPVYEGDISFGYLYEEGNSRFSGGYSQYLYSNLVRGYIGTNLDAVGLAISVVLPYPKFSFTFEYGYYFPIYLKETLGAHSISLKCEF
ncbi:MAG: hypothetical protein DRI36_00110 [Caldiserica bacterium]|nr:MAG: hypothetical protein DRI36_00110 [Caldisericota bacterium]